MEHIELRTFGRGGIHPDSHKRETRDLPIEPMDPVPTEVWLPLSQHIGPPADPMGILALFRCATASIATTHPLPSPAT